MEQNFNSELQELAFKLVYTDRMELISIYNGWPAPKYVIDPLTCTQEEMQQYWNEGLQHLFDIIDNPV